MDHLLTQLFVRWLHRDAARRIPQESVQAGTYVLSYGWPVKALGFVGTVMMTALVFGPLVSGDAPRILNNLRNNPFIAAFLALVFGGLLFLGWGLLNESFRTSIEVSPDEIVANSAWVGRKVIRWDEIEEVSWSQSSNWFVIRSTTGVKIRVSSLIGGVVYLTIQLRQLVPDSKLVKAVPGFHVVDSML